MTRILVTISLFLYFTSFGIAQEQTDSSAALPELQSVDSRKGFIAKIPREATLDSGRSGWNAKNMYERRVYVIDGIGEFVFTVTIGTQTIPDDAVIGKAYIYTQTDSLTSNGTIYGRTYYLPTRRVEIKLIPYSITMQTYLDRRDEIYASFRWKPRANTTVINVDPPTHNSSPPLKSTNSLGG